MNGSIASTLRAFTLGYSNVILANSDVNLGENVFAFG
jgi:hypothetical protein